MKKIWWAVVIALLVTTLCCIEITFTISTASRVDQAIELSLQQYYADDIDNALSTITKASQSWHTAQKRIDIFLYHDTVDSISITLTKAQQVIKSTPEDFPTECQIAKEQLASLKDAQLPYLENIL
ncbi:MAG TPA: DUF4363 family protein [Clostridiales bacterium]|nr:DUF4363 family protein [Clostridiales bacterium]